MTTAQLVNLIVKKFGPGVEFRNIINDEVMVLIGPRMYVVYDGGKCIREQDNGEFEEDTFSNWVESVLSGKVRNDQGVMVEACQ